MIVAQRQPGKLLNMGNALLDPFAGSVHVGKLLGQSTRLKTALQGTVAILAQGTHRGDALCAALFSDQ